MISRAKACVATTAACIGLAVLMTGSASATTLCVPDFTTACPNNGTNVKQPDLQVAMGQDGTDGIADTIHVGAYTYTDPGTLTAPGTDHLTVIGSGTASTFITSALVGGNNFVVDLNSANRSTDMSDLTIQMPASFADNAGAGLQTNKGTYNHVDLQSFNPGSDGAPSLIGSTVWENSHIYGTGTGTIDIGLEPNATFASATYKVMNTTIENAIWAIELSAAKSSTELINSRIIKPVGYGIFMSNGADVSVQNTIFDATHQEAIRVDTDNTPTDTNSLVSVKNSTFLASSDPAKAAIRVEIDGSFGGHSAYVNVADSILSGYDNTWNMIVPAGPGIGNGFLTLTDSNFNPVGLPDDSGQVNFTDPGNINADPKFVSATDYHLTAGSPSIDAGDPAAGGILTDYDGTARPLDGNGDGTRVRDQGAFEAPEIPTCQTDPTLCPPVPTCKTDPSLCPPDKTAPKITKVRFKSPVKKAGFLKFKLSEAATAKVTFKPTKAKFRGKKRKKFSKTLKAKAGQAKIPLKKGKLKPGKYKLRITAIDAAGNRSKTVLKTVRVRTSK